MNGLHRGRRMPQLLRSFTVSLASIGILTGIYAANLLRPFLWVFWAAFLLSAAEVLVLGWFSQPRDSGNRRFPKIDGMKANIDLERHGAPVPARYE